MVFGEYKLVIFELNSLFDYSEEHSFSFNLKYLDVIQKLKEEGKVLCVLAQGIYSNHEIKLSIIQNSKLFDNIIENSEYGELAMMELHDMVNSFINKYDVTQEEIMLVTDKKLDKYLSLDIFTVNWDEVL
ncbi:MAG: hypothetical protein IKM20_07035 [Erysipelotrichales bacterium]|nr:hypothetical protein [Erysipelotrichales bacterium]